MSPRILKPVLLAAGLTALAATYALAIHSRQESIVTPDEPAARGGAAAIYTMDLENPRVLVGYSQNVFAGKVIQEIGRTPNQTTPEIPHIQYDVEVIYNVKGSVRGTAVVDVTVLGGGGLTLGATYMFATRHLEELSPWYFTSTHPANRTMVTQDATLTAAALQKLVRGQERTYELLNAYPNEIVRDIDIQKSRAANAFRSLSDSEKELVFAKFDELIPPRPVPAFLSAPPPPPPDLTEVSGDACRDGNDNDGDGLIDRNDPNCSTYYREDLPSFCRDYKDNDADGKTDAADPDCASYYPTPTPLPPPAPAAVQTSTPPAAPPPPPAPAQVTSTASSTGGM